MCIPKVVIVLTILVFFCVNLQAQGQVNSYDKILTRLDKLAKEEPKVKDEQPEHKESTWTISFEHKKFPNLDGQWLLTKSTKKRLINPVVSKLTTFISCASVLPFEKRDFKDKEIVISSVGLDSFRGSTKYPSTTDVYYDPNTKEEIKYENFGLKFIFDPSDLTYAYTMKLDDFINHPNLSRQIWLHGRLKYERISTRKIIAKGYEIEETPSCNGFIVDEIELVFEKTGYKDESDSAQVQKTKTAEAVTSG